MALNLQGSTIGVDSNEINAAINEFGSYVDSVIQLLDNHYSSLNQKVDEIWVGQSANQFKNNMECDKGVITQRLQEIKSLVGSEFLNIGSDFHRLDEEMANAQGRKG